MAATTAKVGGVEVATDHRIGRRRAPSSDRFADLSPVDGLYLADVAAAGKPEIAQPEVFGPVLTWRSFVDEDEVIALASGARYGLAGTLRQASDSGIGREGGISVREGSFD